MSGSPVSSVLAAVAAGATTLAEITRVTGLSSDLARAVVEQLSRTGRLQATNLASACPSSGCGDCASACTTGPVPLGIPARR